MRPSARRGVPPSQTACLGQLAYGRDAHQGQRPMVLPLSCYGQIRSDHHMIRKGPLAGGVEQDLTGPALPGVRSTLRSENVMAGPALG
jgi:hypothetical protein